MNVDVIEKFILQFDGDNSGALKAIREISGELKKFNGKIGENVEGQEKQTKKTKKTTSAIEDLSKKFIRAYVSISAAKRGYRLFMDQVMRTDAIGKLSSMMGENVSQMYQWGQAAARNGGSVESFSATVAGIENNLAEMQISGNADFARNLAMIGVSAQDAQGDVYKLLELLATATEGMDKTRSMNLLKKLGLDPATILMVQQGRKELEKTLSDVKKTGLIDEKAASSAAEITAAKAKIKQAGSSLLSKGNPYYADMLESITSVIDDPKNMIPFYQQYKYKHDLDNRGIYSERVPKEPLKTDGKSIYDMGAKAYSFMNAYGANPLNACTSGRTINNVGGATSSKMVSIGEINVNGVSDPQTNANTLIKTLESTFRNGAARFEGGGQ